MVDRLSQDLRHLPRQYLAVGPATPGWTGTYSASILVIGAGRRHLECRTVSRVALLQRLSSNIQTEVATGSGGRQEFQLRVTPELAPVRRAVQGSTYRGQRTKTRKQGNKETQTEEGGPGRPGYFRQGPDHFQGSSAEKALRTRMAPMADAASPAIQGRDSATHFGSPS